ncbi:MAG: hypothetical protein KKA79_05125 [Nanoarchaeota archaeon]|nr:hypothetical protein [Nanoarchaeota archaeon]
MKTLLVYYSRTNTTKKVGEEIAKLLKCDSEQIQDVKDRMGLVGYLRSCKEAMMKQMGEIKKTNKDPSKYDLIIVGTPVWSWNISSPVRTYLYNNKGKLKKVAFFCTMGGAGDKRAFKRMEEVAGKKPKATLSLTTKEVVQDQHKNKVREFIKNLKL